METDTFAYGVGADATQLSAVVPVRTCADCGMQFTDEEGERLRHEAVCRHLGLLTPSEIRDIRISYGMRRAEFANVTKLGEATLARWESGSTLPNAAYDRYMRLLRVPDNFARLPGAQTRVAVEPLPSKVIRFPTRRYRILADVPAEIRQAEGVFQLHR
jgi:DNA-binding transcriptional regulator YiaG